MSTVDESRKKGDEPGGNGRKRSGSKSGGRITSIGFIELFILVSATFEMTGAQGPAFNPVPSPTPTPTNPGFGFSQEQAVNVATTRVSTHTLLAPWDFSFSYQPCNASEAQDMYTPTFSSEGCTSYTRLGGAFELLPVSTAIHRGTHHGGVDLGGIGSGDVVWKYPSVNYLAEDRVRFLNYSAKYPEYNSTALPIPPQVFDQSLGAQVTTNYPASIEVVSEPPLIRWPLKPFTFSVPWSTVIKVYVKFNNTTPGIGPQFPTPSPSPSPEPSFSPSPSPSPSPAPIFPIPSPVPDFFIDGPPDLDVPPRREFEWKLQKTSSNPSARLLEMSPYSLDDYVEEGLMECTQQNLCEPSIHSGEALGSAIKVLKDPESESWSLRCQRTNPSPTNIPDDTDNIDDTDDTNTVPIETINEPPRVAIKVETQSAACKLNYISGDPSIIAKAVVVGDFGEPLDDDDIQHQSAIQAWLTGNDLSAPFNPSTLTKRREIIIPNLFTTTPIKYDPSLPLNQSSSPTDILSSIQFPSSELNDPKVYTQSTYDPSSDPLQFRVIQAKNLPQFPSQLTNLLYPGIEGGGIVSCDVPGRLEGGSSPPDFNLFKEIIHVSDDGRKVWFFVPADVLTWYVGTHSGSEVFGTSSQLGVDSLHILHSIQRRLERGIETSGPDGAYAPMPDICNGEGVQIAIDALDAEEGILEGRYDTSKPFVFGQNLTEWLTIHHIPSVPGVCSIAQRVLEERIARNNQNDDNSATFSNFPNLPSDFGNILKNHQENVRYLMDGGEMGSVFDINGGGVFFGVGGFGSGGSGDVGGDRRRNVGSGDGGDGSISSSISSTSSSSRVLSSDASVPLFARQGQRWFVDGTNLYHRITDDDIDRTLTELDNLDEKFGSGGDLLGDLIRYLEENLQINLLIDFSDALINYVGSTTGGYFESAGRCTWYVDDFVVNETITGYISNSVCAPDLVDPGSTLETTNSSGTFVFYDLVFECDENITLLDGNVQSTPGIALGQCVETLSEYVLAFDPDEDLPDSPPPPPPPSDGTGIPEDRNYVFVGECNILLQSIPVTGGTGDNGTDPIVFDQTSSRCSATYDAICNQFGVCPNDRNFFDKYGPYLYAVIAVTGVALIFFIFWVCGRAKRKKELEQSRGRRQRDGTSGRSTDGLQGKGQS